MSSLIVSELSSTNMTNHSFSVGWLRFLSLKRRLRRMCNNNQKPKQNHNDNNNNSSSLPTIPDVEELTSSSQDLILCSSRFQQPINDDEDEYSSRSNSNHLRSHFYHQTYHQQTKSTNSLLPFSLSSSSSFPLLLLSLLLWPFWHQKSLSSSRRISVKHRYKLSMLILIIIMIINEQLIGTMACGPGRGGSRRRSPRKLMPLVFKQHIPNVSENTLGASGLNEGPITRNHSRFKELVPNYNQDILFKDEEGTGADRLMTQRLKEKLNTLAISVMNQWPGVRLRVIEGWDEEGSHSSNSLHYEGRAVDITTSDRDRSKYGMLARLAVEAGFDWVYYESRFHIHCSVKSEKSESARNGGCFDETSSVVSRQHGPINIQKLKIGDEILVMNSQTGQYEYSPVIMFLDRDPQTKRLYYEFETDSGARITTTPSHLLFIADDPNDPTGREEFAKNIQIGQYLYRYIENDQPTKMERIKSIQTEVGRGSYAPLTEAGNLVVNNITASCYAVVRNQQLSHWSFFPIRLVYNFIQFGDRLSEMLYIRKVNIQRRSTDPELQIGIHWYPKMLYTLFQYFIPNDLLYN